MAVNREIWLNYIAENLFEDNPHLDKCIDNSAGVNGYTVHIPSAGTAATVTRNNTSYPVAVTERSDNDAYYTIDSFQIGPIRLDNADQYELSYDKMRSVMNDFMMGLREEIGTWLNYKWAASASAYIVRTTGNALSTNLANSTATGTRKVLLAYDLMMAAKALDDIPVPAQNRWAMLDTTMYYELLNDLKFGEFRRTVEEADLKRGIIPELFGFGILKRPTIFTYTNASTPVVKAPGAAAATSDNRAAICWQADMVEKAMGSIDWWDTESAEHFTKDLIAAEIRFGGRKRRYDGAGVVSIVQAAG